MKLLPPEEFAGLTEADCIRIQQELAPCVVPENRFSGELPRTAAGVDLAYWQESGRERAVCCIVTIDCQTGEILEKQHAAGPVDFPYLPGCFAFRELPLVLEAAARLREKQELFIFDGNGILHPRGLGLASHASFYLETPTMGVAKHYYKVAGLEPPAPGPAPGSWGDIVRDGAILGRAVRTHAGVKPVYVSVGNWVDLDTATRLALQLTGKGSHIPIPTQYADLETHAQRQRLKGKAIQETVE